MKPRQSAPLALRLIHGVVFLGLAAATLAAAQIELLQLQRVLAQPWTSGTLPLPVPLAAAAGAGGCAVAFVACLTTGRSAPLGLSLVMVGAFVGALLSRENEVAGRTHFGGNLPLVRLMDGVHAEVRSELQQRGEAPAGLADWKERVERSAKRLYPPEGRSLFHRRFAAAAPFGVQLIATEEANPADAVPGTVLVYVSADQASFTLLGVGLDERGKAVRIRDPEGKLVQFKGVFNPDTMR